MRSAVILMSLLYGCMLIEGYPGTQVDIEATLNSKELIQYWQYPCEEYAVMTEDGYINTLFRIPHGRVKDISESLNPKPVVFLQHGLLVDAANWYQNLPHNSLAFILADAGYDVWLGNSRGTTWSKKHNSLSPIFAKYWEFSYDHMAKYDLPTFINFVLQKTGQQQVYYIGHSQGTTMAFIAFSTNPLLAAKIKLFIALAPVATVKHARTPLATLGKLTDLQVKLLFGDKDFLPKSYFGSRVAAAMCSQQNLALFCENLLFIAAGVNENNLNLSRIDVYAAHAPAGTSVQNMIHWKQAFNGGKLQAFDYGWLRNQIHYNQAEPPEYDVTKMTVPTAIWSCENDWLSGPTDVDALIPKIKNLILHERILKWNHLDPLFGLDVNEKLYSKILNLLQKDP
ncbi:lysosomal acid lipase/cholesteryl ester hydrolase-like [Anolis sagrei]|uniref:lysosomal acid lipase/cholesteryl ester hydrolase-like n=1 Tax=Anolis sagrei TaxID=38937 RepID=UPI00351FD1BE